MDETTDRINISHLLLFLYIPVIVLSYSKNTLDTLKEKHNMILQKQMSINCNNILDTKQNEESNTGFIF